MANNSIKGRFRALYQKVEENLSDESKTKLKELNKLNTNALYDYLNSLIKLLEIKYLKVLTDLGAENGISIDEIERRMVTCYIWDNYGLAIEKLNETIRKYRSEEEFNRDVEKIFEPIMNQSEEETAYWSALRSAINGYDDFIDYDEDVDEEIKNDNHIQEDSEEDEKLNDLVYRIEEMLHERLTFAVKEVESELNITGQVIDFLIDLVIEKNIMPQK